MARPPLSIPGSELRALCALIERLNGSDVLTTDEAQKRNRENFGKSFDRMSHNGETYGTASGAPAIFNQSTAAFQQELRSINDKLGLQVQITDQLLDAWFERGESLPPHWPWRITVILRKAKRFDLERRFLAALIRHFSGPSYSTFAERAAKINLAIDLPPEPDELGLDIGVKDFHPIAGSETSLHFNFEFCCQSCGGYLLEIPEGDDDQRLVSCTACERTFGTFSQIREAAMEVGRQKMKRLKLGAYATP